MNKYVRVYGAHDLHYLQFFIKVKVQYKYDYILKYTAQASQKPFSGFMLYTALLKVVIMNDLTYFVCVLFKEIIKFILQVQLNQSYNKITFKINIVSNKPIPELEVHNGRHFKNSLELN